MIPIDQCIRITLKKAGHTFQLLAGFDELKSFRSSPSPDLLYEVLGEYKIFKDAQRGENASPKSLQEAFGDMSEEEIMMTILKDGDEQIPTAHLNKLREEIKSQVIHTLATNAVNPKASIPYTVTLIEEEVNKLKFNFTHNTPVEKQTQEVLKLLQQKIPISMEMVTLSLEIPVAYAGKCYQILHKGKIIQQDYTAQHLIVKLEISPGQKDALLSKLQSVTGNSTAYTST